MCSILIHLEAHASYSNYSSCLIKTFQCGLVHIVSRVLSLFSGMGRYVGKRRSGNTVCELTGMQVRWRSGGTMGDGARIPGAEDTVGRRKWERGKGSNKDYQGVGC